MTIAVLFLVASGATFAGADLRQFGEARVLAQAPAPWYIEGAAVFGERLFVGTGWGLTGQFAATYSLGEPSRIFVYDLGTGNYLDTILVEGEDTTRDHGLLGLKADGSGRIYAASQQLGILRFTESEAGWTQETYAMFPDLPSCTLAPAPCSPTKDDDPSHPNDMAWDANGNLYVSDSWQATVWKVPPGMTPAARTPGAWYQHESLDRAFGPNGLRIAPSGDALYLAVCCPDSFAVGPIDRASRVVRIPFPDPGAVAPTDFFVLQTGEDADGIEFSADGSLYVAANFGNKVLVVGPDGILEREITNDDLIGDAVFDFPATVLFNDPAGTMLVVNYAWNSAASHFEVGANGTLCTPEPAAGALACAAHHHYVLEVYVGESGWPERRPVVP